jgi:hypothetical protein
VVKLSIRQDLKATPSLADRLDYGERDDQLIGIADAFLQENPHADVRVLTHDTGPMASAKMVGIAFIEIPDDWLLPPESTATDKRIASLETQVARLKAAEPRFSIELIKNNKFADSLERNGPI